MGTELTRFTVKTEEDLLKLHELCMQLGSWAGLPVPERIRFAASIATLGNPCNNEVIQIGFSLEEIDNRTCLSLEIQNQTRKTEKRILQPLSEIQLPPLTDIVEDRKGDDEKGYWDRQQFTFALSHDLKNSLTKLKLSLSLLEDEEMTPEIRNYFRIIQRSAERLENIFISFNKIIQLRHTSPDVVI
jgi:signal transduction histidine kinase